MTVRGAVVGGVRLYWGMAERGLWGLELGSRGECCSGIGSMSREMSAGLTGGGALCGVAAVEGVMVEREEDSCEGVAPAKEGEGVQGE